MDMVWFHDTRTRVLAVCDFPQTKALDIESGYLVHRRFPGRYRRNNISIVGEPILFKCDFD
jgi:hypothetical protein